MGIKVNIETAISELATEEKVPSTIEFMVQEDFINHLPVIVSNLEQIERWAIEQTERDRNVVLLTDEDFENAKLRSTQLNKQIKLIEDKRKEIKRMYNEPYEMFEKASKKVTEILSKARENLWDQVSKAEDKQKEEKKDRIRAYWNEKTRIYINSFKSFEQIFDKRWLNKCFKYETVCSEMDSIFDVEKNNMQAIRLLNSEFQVSLLEYYKDGHSLGETIAYNNRLQAQKQAEIEREKENQCNAREKEENDKFEAKNEPIRKMDDDEELFYLDFYVNCTRAQLKALAKFLKDNKIEYGRIYH